MDDVTKLLRKDLHDVARELSAAVIPPTANENENDLEEAALRCLSAVEEMLEMLKAPVKFAMWTYHREWEEAAAAKALPNPRYANGII